MGNIFHHLGRKYKKNQQKAAIKGPAWVKATKGCYATFVRSARTPKHKRLKLGNFNSIKVAVTKGREYIETMATFAETIGLWFEVYNEQGVLKVDSREHSI